MGITVTAGGWLAACAMVAAGASAFLACWHWLDVRALERRRKEAAGLDQAWLGEGRALQRQGMAARVLCFLVGLDRRLQVGAARSWAPSGRSNSAADQELIRHAGLSGALQDAALREGALRLGLLAGLGGALLGCVFSWELAAVLGAAGVLAGLFMPRWALRKERDARCAALGRELPELLEVMGLGLRSGLSFDRCFALYHQHFNTAFAQSCAMAQQQWSLGLKSREQGLRDLALAYNSAALTRVVETMIRSLRFGSQLAESLEQAAQQARADYKAQKEEQVAKAPVKMMLPTGTLILPAMLLLVLGPVLLELMEGF